MSDDDIHDDDDDYPPLSDEDVAELQRRIDDLEDPARYMIQSDLGYTGSFLLWYDVTGDMWCSDQPSGTMFKREEHAQAVFDCMESKSFTSVIPVLADLVEASEDEDDTEK